MMDGREMRVTFTRRVRGWADRARVVVPYLVLPAVAAMLTVRFIVYDDEGGMAGDIATIAIAVILTALILTRQALEVRAKRRLEVSLRQLSEELEQRVVRRTEELAVEKEHLALLNRVAAEMSQCVTAKEVVRRGLNLARRTARCSATCMLLERPGHRPQFFGTHGLPRGDRRQLLVVLRREAARGVGPEAGPVVVEGPRLEYLLAGAGVEHTFNRVVVLPLVSRRSAFGLLGVCYRGPSKVAMTPIMGLVQGVASQVAVTLENVWRFDDVEQLAERDPVTGLFNHRGVSKRLELELARSQRSGSPFSLVTMDVDGFKLFNDTYGHALGDEALRQVARTLRKMLRRSDIVGRQGGDEFSAVLPGTSSEQALECIERVREALCESAVSIEGHSLVPLFVSFSIATYPDDGERVSDLLANADGNLYRSKQRGGNCVSVAHAKEDHEPGPVGVFSVLDGLVNAVDNKDHYTRKHSEDVTELAVALAGRMGLSIETVRSLRMAALLHDVGKIGIPDHILRKPGPLSAAEFEAIKQHVSLSELFIKEIPDLADVLGAVGAHHERWDGCGYPRGLGGTDIPMLGRILAVSDAYSAMTTDRPYRKALSREQARSEMSRVAGAQLDPQLVSVFLEMVSEMDPALSGGDRARAAAAGRAVG